MRCAFGGLGVATFRSHNALRGEARTTPNEFQRSFLQRPDFRRQIPMKPVSRQTDKIELAPQETRTTTMMPSDPQPGDVDRCDFDEEERCDRSPAELCRNQPRVPGRDFWDFKINILGVKDDTPIHFCDTCELPIKIYGRMIPCKHVFCYGCASLLEQKAERLCPSCNNPVRRIDQYMLGTLFMCTTVQGCKRTYLSQRDLEAHINFRHYRTVPDVTPLMENVPTPVVLPLSETLNPDLEKHQVSQAGPQHIRMPPSPLLLEPHTLGLENLQDSSREIPVPPAQPLNLWVEQDPYGFLTKKSDNIIFPVQNDSNAHVGEVPLPVPAHYSEYQPNPIFSPWGLYGVPLPLPPVSPFPSLPLLPAARYSMQLPSQVTGMSSVAYSQASLPSATSVPPQISPSSDYAVAQMLPYVDHLTPGTLPPHQPVDLSLNEPGLHHHYPDSWLPPPDDKETLGLPYTQPWEMDPDLEPASKRLHLAPPPAVPRRRRRRRRRMQGPSEPSQDDQTRFEPYGRQ